MGRIDWRLVIVGSMMGVLMAGCAGEPAPRASVEIGRPGDADYRQFTGTIVSLRPMISTMLISKDEVHGKDQYPNIIRVKYDAQTKFYLDNQPATLDQFQQYMIVKVDGHMRDGELVAESANFSSVLPMNVKPAGQITKDTK